MNLNKHATGDRVPTAPAPSLGPDGESQVILPAGEELQLIFMQEGDDRVLRPERRSLAGRPIPACRSAGRCASRHRTDMPRVARLR